jgi:predicted nucleic acid-binding protein
MRLYLDMCALKRPFDDQEQERVASDTRAVFAIEARIEHGLDELVWSTALTLENDADPDPEARLEVAKYARRAKSSHTLTPGIESRLRALATGGLRPLDATHVAFAEAAACNVLITCDDRLIRRAERAGSLIRVMNPIEYLREVGHGEQSD